MTRKANGNVKAAAKKKAGAFEEAPYSELVWWVPGQGLVDIKTRLQVVKDGELFLIGKSEKGWWIIFDEHRKVWCDGWETEEKALDWAETSLADTVRKTSLRGRPPELPTA